jgi:hypothetical protein
MNISEMVEVYKQAFGKGLNVLLKLEKPFYITDEFSDYFIEKICGKEVQFSHFKGSVIDTDRWVFGGDLSIKMMSIPIYQQEVGYYEEHVILYADLEKYLKKMPLHKLLRLKKYVYEPEQEDFIEYVQLVANDQMYGG